MQTSPSKGEIVGEWVNTGRWDDGTLPEQQPIITKTTLNLRKDGLYEESSDSKSTKTNFSYRTYSQSGVWMLQGNMLILHPAKVEAGIVPKKLSSRKYQITDITRARLTLKTQPQLTTFTRVH